MDGNLMKALAQQLEGKSIVELERMEAPIELPTEQYMYWHTLRDRRIAVLKREREAQLAKEIAERKQLTLAVPDGGAADLLERQIGTCAGLIHSLAEYVAQNEPYPDVCVPFMDRIGNLLNQSAKAARVVGQLRGVVPETRQTYVTVRGEREGGSRQT